MLLLTATFSGGQTLNVRAAPLHVLADLLGSLGVVVAAILVITLDYVLVGAGEDCHARRRELADMLDRELGIHHTTLQVEHTSAQGRLHPVTGARLSPPRGPSDT